MTFIGYVLYVRANLEEKKIHANDVLSTTLDAVIIIS